MRCRSCDKALTEFESKSKDPLSGDYLDLCRRCRAWSMGTYVIDKQEEDTKDMEYLVDKSIDGRPKV